MATDIVPEAEREASSSSFGSKDNVPCAHHVMKAELLIEVISVAPGFIELDDTFIRACMHERFRFSPSVNNQHQ